MQITITKNQKSKPSHLNCYRIAIKFMYGDADGYATKELFIPKNEKNETELPRFLTFLESCGKAYRHGRGGADTYEHVADYDRYVDPYPAPSLADPNRSFTFSWEYEPDGSVIHTSYYNYEITYFDDNNVEYLVDVTK